MAQSALGLETRAGIAAFNWPFQRVVSGGCRRVGFPAYPFQRKSYRSMPSVDSGAPCLSVKSTDQPGEQRADECLFRIDWQPPNRQEAPAEPPRSGSFLCPTGETPWVEVAKGALLSAGICLVPVTSPQEAGPLGGLLCMWHADGDTLPGDAGGDIARAGPAPGRGPGRVQAAPGLMRSARNECPHLALRLVPRM